MCTFYYIILWIESCNTWKLNKSETNFPFEEPVARSTISWWASFSHIMCLLPWTYIIGKFKLALFFIFANPPSQQPPHILNGCSVALQQGRYTVVRYPVTLWGCCSVCWYWWLQTCQCPFGYYFAIHCNHILSSWLCYLLLYDQHHKIKLLELTCPFKTTRHLQAAHEHKPTKPEYQLLLSELDRLGYSTLYSTIEIARLLGTFSFPINQRSASFNWTVCG